MIFFGRLQKEKLYLYYFLYEHQELYISFSDYR